MNTRHSEPAYQSWKNMIQRCQNPENPDYKYYGGRGITVSEDWLIYENFKRDMGDRPEGRTLDRIDNNQGYNKDNCRWSNYLEQRRNRSDVILDVEIVTNIAEKLIKGATTRALAAEYKVSAMNVSRIGRRIIWPEAMDQACKRLASELRIETCLHN